MIINIKADIPDRWADDFCSLLKYMEYCGNIEHSCTVGIYADGNGDFRPEFEFDYDYQVKEGFQDWGGYPERIFDAV